MATSVFEFDRFLIEGKNSCWGPKKKNNSSVVFNQANLQLVIYSIYLEAVYSCPKLRATLKVATPTDQVWSDVTQRPAQHPHKFARASSSRCNVRGSRTLCHFFHFPGCFLPVYFWKLWQPVLEQKDDFDGFTNWMCNSLISFLLDDG